MQPTDGSRPTAFAAATLNLFAGAEIGEYETLLDEPAS